MRKFDTYLPYVPSMEEVDEFISTITDIKVKAMVSLLYGSGLRIGEVCNLKYEDVERKNMRVHIRHSKNRSDRYAIHLISLPNTGSSAEDPEDTSFLSNGAMTAPSIPFI